MYLVMVLAHFVSLSERICDQRNNEFNRASRRGVSFSVVRSSQKKRCIDRRTCSVEMDAYVLMQARGSDADLIPTVCFD